MFKRSLIFAAVLLCALVPAGAQSQAQMNQQARASFEHADAELNTVYKKLFDQLADAEAKQNLRDSQRAWMAFRDAEASFVANRVRSGSAAPTFRYESLRETTEQRIKQLKSDLPQ